MARSRAILALVRFIDLGVSGVAAPARADIPPPAHDFQRANIGDRKKPAYAGGPPVDVRNSRCSMSYAYRILKLEITTRLWADFLNTAPSQGANLYTCSLKPNFWGQAGGVTTSRSARRRAR